MKSTWSSIFWTAQKTNFQLLGLAALACGCVSKTSDDRQMKQLKVNSECRVVSGANRQNYTAPRLLFLSLDGLNFKGLSELVPKLKNPHSHGLKALLQHENRNPNLIIQNPTITASSHTSTMTCSAPAVHGIFANSQWNGDKFVSGFSEVTETQTFANALFRAGLKVVSAGYPAIDNSESGKTVSEGFTYGETVGRSSYVNLSHNTPVQHVWQDKNGNKLAAIQIMRQEADKLKITCDSSDCRINQIDESGLFNVELKFGEQKGVAYISTAKNNQVFISKIGINKAFPQEIHNQLNDCGIIFSPGKEIPRDPTDFVPFLKGLEHRHYFFRNVWTSYIPQTAADAVFLYLEDIDALRHQFEGVNSAQTQTMEHLARVDQTVGALLKSLPPSTNVVVMGDHGMSAVKKEINVRKILPEEALNNSIVVTSGGTLLMYGKRNQAGKKIDSIPSKEDLPWLTSSRNALLQLRVKGDPRPVFEKVLIKNTEEMKKEQLNHPRAPFLIAFANDTFALNDSVVDKLILADLDDSAMPRPNPPGQHGHFNGNASMHSYLVMWGPELDRLKAADIKDNIRVIPAIAHALKWPIPNQCKSWGK